jgi:hypothetical protein
MKGQDDEEEKERALKYKTLRFLEPRAQISLDRGRSEDIFF